MKNKTNPRKMKTCIYLVAWLLCFAPTQPLLAQQSSSHLDYLQSHKDIAVREMLRSGIPASILLAHGFLASGAGQNELAEVANNHFGTVCGDNWAGATHDKLTYDQSGALVPACFRVYPSAAASFRDFTRSMTSPGRIGAYRMLFKLATTDYYGWAMGLELSGMSIGGNYAQKMIKVIEDYGLYRYDVIFYMQGSLPERYWSTDEDRDPNTDKLAANEGEANYETDRKIPGTEYGFREKTQRTPGYGTDLAHARPGSITSNEQTRPQLRVGSWNYGGQLLVDAGSRGRSAGRYSATGQLVHPKADAGFDKDQFAQSSTKADVVLASYSREADRIYPSLPKTSLVRKVYHKVNKTETLQGIARQYRTTVIRLIKVNKLGNKALRAGMVLRVR
jgi:LysM repeat protein